MLSFIYIKLVLRGDILKKANRVKKSKASVLATIIFVFITLYFVVTIFNQAKLKKDLGSKMVDYQEEIELIEDDIDELTGEIESSNSLHFVEKIAREELGMVKPREIVIIDKNKKGKKRFNLNSIDN